MALAKFTEDIAESVEENISNAASKKCEASFLSKVTPPRHFQYGFVQYNPTKKRVEIHFECELSDAKRNILVSQKWNYHPAKLFWSKGCSAKMKIKENINFATILLKE